MHFKKGEVMGRTRKDGLIREYREVRCPMFQKTISIKKCDGCKNFMGEVFTDNGIFIECKERHELDGC